MVTKDYLKLVLSDKKKFLTMKEVSFINPPHYDEISVIKIYEKMITLPGMINYFPDKYPKGRSCSKEYMYNVFNTLYPEDVKKLIEFANEQRYSVTSEKNKGDAIEISESWKEQLESLPFVSKQKGRMSHLLKQKSKVGVIQKERRTFDSFDFVKKKKYDDGSETIIPQNKP